MALDAFANINRAGLNCYRLKPKEELISVAMARDEDDLILGHKERPIDSVCQQRTYRKIKTSWGVRGIRLGKGDEIHRYGTSLTTKATCSSSVPRDVGNCQHSVTILRKGAVGKGVITLNITRNTGDVAAATVINNDLREGRDWQTDDPDLSRSDREDDIGRDT